ncbi:MAG: glycosyltransferase family 39 protein [Candidatus Rokubacteria bacterium]|nr:glycosyltransferase family 39 protein [Candidatus Rokubacteria bacterium]
MQRSSPPAPAPSGPARRFLSRALDPRFALPALLLVAAVLLFTGLDDRYLWDDEAETALLARRIQAIGLPIAHDGRDLISQGCGLDADRNYLWAFHPWLPMYLTAGSFALLGESTFTARLPFALLGFASVLSLYFVAQRVSGDRRVALLACAFLTASVPFLLHARQSRYYAISVFAAVWMLHCFVTTIEGRRSGVVGLVLASTAMFHANHGLFLGTFGALTVAYMLVFRPPLAAIARIAVAGAATLALNATWLVIYGGAWIVSFGAGPPKTIGYVAWKYWQRNVAHFQSVDFFFIGSAIVAVFLVWLAVEGRRLVADSRALRLPLFLTVFMAAYVMHVAVFPFTFIRYLLGLLPAVAILQAWIVTTLGRRRPVLGAILLVLALGTDVFYGWPSEPRVKLRRGFWSPLLAYVEEIATDYDGPIETMVRYLQANARAGETVYITYGDLPLRFYTDLEVRGGNTCERPFAVPPDWIVIRHFFRFKTPTPGVNEDAVRTREYVDREIPWAEYERIELPVRDIVWDSIPEPQMHHFRPPPDNAPVPRLVLYHRVKGRAPAG